MNSTSPAPFARPQRVEANTENRGTLLRASILESALELGLGTNRTVANWMFNAVPEGDEEDNEQGVASPSLTYASTATSEESNLSAGHAQPQQQRTQPGAGILISNNGKGTLDLNLDTSVQYSQRNGLSPARGTPEPTQRALQFDLRATPDSGAISPAPSSVQTKNKLRKPRPDGYESDGGYVSESGKAKKGKEKKEKEKKSKKKGKDKDKGGEGEVGGATDYESDGGYLSEAIAKRKKSKKEKKEKKEKEKDKSKSADSPTTDYETDKGYSSTFSRGRSHKQASVTSPTSGDESDGGYLSESSKKRRFFRLNSKSRKKQDSFDSMQDQPPPVPALPLLPLPIHEKFSRAASPLPIDTYTDVRPSVETLTSVDTVTSVDTSLTVDTTSTTVESDEKHDSVFEAGGLTRAFADAESVRSPSIDFLSTFRRPATDSRPGSPLSPSRFNPFSHGNRPNSPLSAKPSAAPALSPSKSVRARPKISAPNTTTLAPKHVPVPLTLTPPTPTSQHHPPNHIPPSPDPDYVVVTPNPSTPLASEQNSPANMNGTNTNGTSVAPPPQSPTLQRPRVISFHDLPPPSPPPRGPLPDVPQDISRSTSPSWSMMDSSPLRNSQQRSILFASPNTATHPLSREITQDVPTISQPAPPTQRGRVSPFPTAPVFPREQTTPLVRRTSKIAREAVNRVQNQNTPASASPYADGHARWPSHEQVRGPTSAQVYPAPESRWPSSRPREQLGVRWAPRSSSAMDTRRPANGEDASSSDDGRSWLVYDDDDEDNGGISDRSLSVPNTRPASTEPPEPSPDVNTILAGFRAQRDARLTVRKDRSDMLSARDALAGIVAGYERDTVYLDVDDGGGDRTSVWSEANSQHSFLDGEKSAAIRDKFVKRVEAMYGKDVVPPVPRLDEGLSSRSG